MQEVLASNRNSHHVPFFSSFGLYKVALIILGMKRVVRELLCFPFGEWRSFASNVGSLQEASLCVLASAFPSGRG